MSEISKDQSELHAVSQRPEDTPLSIAMTLGSATRRAGGVFYAVRSDAQALVAAGHRVTVFAPHDADAPEDVPSWAPVKAVIATPVGPAALGFAPGIGRELDAGEFDLLHQHGLWQALSLQSQRWRRRADKPVVISPHGMLDPWAVRHAGWKKALARCLFEGANLAGAACLFALNSAEAKAIRAYGLTNPIAILPNGVDLDDARSGSAARPELLGSDERKTLLFLGRLHPKKGLAELIAAWAQLKARAPQIVRAWRLVLAGWDDGGHRDRLERQTAEAGLSNDILFPGPVHGAEKAEVLAHADAFVLPSYSEGLPVAILEAWANRLPVFMTAACNLPEGFSAGAAVEITTEPTTLAKALSAHLGDDLTSLGEAGRELVESRFTWQQIAQDQIAVYRWLLGGGPPPAAISDL